MPFTDNATVRKQWIDATVEAVDSHFLDGITFDYESPMVYNATTNAQYVTLIQETRAALRKTNPNTQVRMRGQPSTTK